MGRPMSPQAPPSISPLWERAKPVFQQCTRCKATLQLQPTAADDYRPSLRLSPVPPHALTLPVLRRRPCSFPAHKRSLASRALRRPPPSPGTCTPTPQRVDRGCPGAQPGSNHGWSLVRSQLSFLYSRDLPQPAAAPLQPSAAGEGASSKGPDCRKSSGRSTAGSTPARSNAAGS